MKLLGRITVLATAALASGIANADSYGFAGCGAGTKLFGPTSMQTSAATTNHGTVPLGANTFIGLPTSQPWSISFDLAGCSDDAMPVAWFKQYDYMFANFASLSKEMAQGSGDVLAGFAATFECPSWQIDEFNKFSKVHFAAIFSQPGIYAAFQELRSLLEKDPVLAKVCKLDGEKVANSGRIESGVLAQRGGEK